MKTKFCITTLCKSAALALALFATQVPERAAAQSLFEAVITVNDAPITRFELEQRTRMLQLLRAPGDPRKLAREQLIEDRLKLQAARRDGIEVSEEEVQAGMDRFASQGGLTGEELAQRFEGAGVSEESFRAFIRAGVTWAELTRAKFGPRVSVTEEDIDRAREAIGRGGGVEVLMSEIIIPYTPQTQEQVEETARRIAEVTSESAFSAEARRYSATRTKGNGGRLPWTPISDLPPALQGIVLSLAPGDVTDPLPLEGAIALFQLRDIRETEVPEPTYAAIEYAAYYIAGGRSKAAIARAQRIEADTDTCDDLYGIAQGQPESVLERGSKAPGEIPQDIAYELSKLDPGEVSYALTRANGETLVLLMLCGRSETIEDEEPVVTAEDETTADSEAGEQQALSLSETERLSRQIGDQRLNSYAQGYLAELKADARIVEK
ncbi:peptidylprolyl isomerase [Roseovarius sp. SCSIO 43702]|uniref:peptidylprolyl isomerase n=1 Tax=Roseovarius sp. SCSIO 43702 TaxID=2823043 RepID=UPI002175A22E|nr:peptidylprolyl isomerase [Roseovarius sp. SCSIO 43702]